METKDMKPGYLRRIGFSILALLLPQLAGTAHAYGRTYQLLVVEIRWSESEKAEFFPATEILASMDADEIWDLRLNLAIHQKELSKAMHGALAARKKTHKEAWSFNADRTMATLIVESSTADKIFEDLQTLSCCRTVEAKSFMHDRIEVIAKESESNKPLPPQESQWEGPNAPTWIRRRQLPGRPLFDSLNDTSDLNESRVGVLASGNLSDQILLLNSLQSYADQIKHLSRNNILFLEKLIGRLSNNLDLLDQSYKDPRLNGLHGTQKEWIPYKLNQLVDFAIFLIEKPHSNFQIWPSLLSRADHSPLLKVTQNSELAYLLFEKIIDVIRVQIRKEELRKVAKKSDRQSSFSKHFDLSFLFLMAQSDPELRLHFVKTLANLFIDIERYNFAIARHIQQGSEDATGRPSPAASTMQTLVDPTSNPSHPWAINAKSQSQKAANQRAKRSQLHPLLKRILETLTQQQYPSNTPADWERAQIMTIAKLDFLTFLFNLISTDELRAVHIRASWELINRLSPPTPAKITPLANQEQRRRIKVSGTILKQMLEKLAPAPRMQPACHTLF
jgi:hypothetical protein